MESKSQRVYYWIVLITCECYEKIAAALEDMRAVKMREWVHMSESYIGDRLEVMRAAAGECL